MTTITICTTCRMDKANDEPLRDGRRLLDAVSAAAGGKTPAVQVRGIQCMSACKTACAAQISGDGRFTYVLAHLDPTRDTEDLLAFAATHGQKEHGLVIKSTRPEAIKDKVIARVPPPGFSGFPLVDDTKD